MWPGIDLIDLFISVFSLISPKDRDFCKASTFFVALALLRLAPSAGAILTQKSRAKEKGYAPSPAY